MFYKVCSGTAPIVMPMDYVSNVRKLLMHAPGSGLYR